MFTNVNKAFHKTNNCLTVIIENHDHPYGLCTKSSTMKFTAGIPLIFSMVSFVLTMLCLFAGSKKGFMEDYHIMVFNTSTLGQNFVESLANGDSSSSATTASATATSTSSSGGILGGGIGGIISTIEASATAVVGSMKSEAASILNDVGNDVADKLANELGIDQFYSIHVMDLCQGDFSPNATVNNPSYNITNCTTVSYDPLFIYFSLDSFTYSTQTLCHLPLAHAYANIL